MKLRKVTPRQQFVDPLQSERNAGVQRRQGWFWLAAIMLPLVALLGAELGLRLAGYGYPTAFFLERTQGGRRVLSENQRFGYRFFPPRLARTPQPLVMEAQKPRQTYRIFVFGESAAMGDPEPDFGPARMLQVMLEDQYPGTTFEVVNAAMTAINSHAVLEIARDSASRQGNLWVVYMGNNEVIGPFGAGTVFGAAVPSRAVIRITLALGRTRLGQLVEALSRGLLGGRSMPNTWGGLKMFLGHQVRSDDARLGRVREHYGRNLAEIIGLGRAAGAKVVVCTVASNLKECAPFGSQHRGSLTSQQLSAWEKVFNQGVALETARQFADALVFYRQAAEIDDSFAALQFRLGRCLLALDKFAEARRAFQRARDEDTLRFRADTQNNEIVRAVAANRAAEGVYLVDAEQELARHSPDGIPGLDIFWEHVHFNFAGTHALAESLARQVAEILPGSVSQARASRPWLSTQACARRLTYCRWNDHNILSEICRRHQTAPCTLQLDHAQRDRLWQRKLAEQQPAIQGAALRQAIAGVQAVVRLHPTDWVLHKNLGELLEAAGYLSAALEEWRRVSEMAPQYGNAWYHLGNLLDTQGQSAEAQAYFEKALDLSPYMAEAMSGLGLALAAQGKFDRAFAQYAKAIETNPESIHAYINWGLGLASRQKFAEAIKKYELALRINPTDVTAHNNLGAALAALGQGDEAIRHYARAVELQPDFLAARLNLGRELVRQGRGEQALLQFGAVLELNPNQPEAHLQLGLAQERLGHRPEAVEQFREALRLAPANPAAQAALARLQPPAEAAGSGSAPASN
ncbi:MAG TPA: tetratricopeptide repeat protein [Dongiaceae bacterium]|nr:tetratricopeptide repeat protein [Dongiaceae bacterium]